MKNKTGKFIGFVLGVAGFLFLFKILILDRTSPEDELAPGIVVMISAVCGVVLAFIGSQVQNYLGSRK